MTVDREERGEPASSRRCIVSGVSMPMDALMRFVVGPEGVVVPDLRGVLGGRGIWVGADRVSVETAVRKNLFQRAARMKLSVPDGLADMVEAGLTKRVLADLSLARKAGQAVAGFEKTAEKLAGGGCSLVMLASDAAPNAVRKAHAMARDAEILCCLSAAEMGSVFGRERAVNVAVENGGLAVRIKIDGQRLGGFRGKPVGEVDHDE